MSEDVDLYQPAGPRILNDDGEIKSFVEDNGSIRVTLQDSVAPLFQYYIMDEQKTDITLTSDAAIGDEVVNVSSGHGFTPVAGEYIVLFENDTYAQIRVKSVATDAITLQEPLTVPFTIADAVVVRGNILMNVDGSSTPVEFILNLRNFTIPIDIGTVSITMQHGVNVPDDGRFGGLSALTNGLFFKKEDGSTFSFGNYIINQDFRDMGGSIDYAANAPSGTNATNITFDMKTIFGQVIRLRPLDVDMIVGIVRDNISAGAGMAKMTVSFIGSYTEGEA